MLLSVIRVVDSSNQLVMKFDATDVKPHLPYHVAFQINVIYDNHLIRRTVVDEGASNVSCPCLVGKLLVLQSLPLLPLS
jgi:hypothetical protein